MSGTCGWNDEGGGGLQCGCGAVAGAVAGAIDGGAGRKVPGGHCPLGAMLPVPFVG